MSVRSWRREEAAYATTTGVRGRPSFLAGSDLLVSQSFILFRINCFRDQEDSRHTIILNVNFVKSAQLFFIFLSGDHTSDKDGEFSAMTKTKPFQAFLFGTRLGSDVGAIASGRRQLTLRWWVGRRCAVATGQRQERERAVACGMSPATQTTYTSSSLRRVGHRPSFCFTEPCGGVVGVDSRCGEDFLDARRHALLRAICRVLQALSAEAKRVTPPNLNLLL